MEENKRDVNLLDFWGVVKEKWKFLLPLILIAGAGMLGVSFLFADRYKAEVLVKPAETMEQQQGLPSNLGSIAALAGFNFMTGATNKDEYVAVLKSKQFLFDFIKSRELLPVLFRDEWDSSKNAWRDQEDPQTLLDAYIKFTEDVLNVEEDATTGLITVSVSWEDPDLAALWANGLLRDVNLKIQRETIATSQKNLAYLEAMVQKTNLQPIRDALYVVIETEIKQSMLANATDQFAFKIIDPAIIPEEKHFPSRLAFLVIGLAIGLCFAFFYIMAKAKSK